MSTLLTITQMIQANDDLIGFTNQKITDIGNLFRGFSLVAGIGFVIVQAIISRGAMARIIISGLAAALFIYIVFNVTDLSDRVDNELSSAPPAATAAAVPST
ncbi:hypothetical protein [Nocardioides sp.]|uniref:hypothetical protein n=1 Tax=Nocardioides sp. TaxID=35761 RepID=UPI002734FDB1|nr:hypothetical protein [Nocardioides sp.]MDP3893616.1 hypothetical protein [Nocardioides sp.]